MVRNESETSEKCATSWKMPLWFFEYGWRCFRQIWNQLALGMWWVNKKNGAKVDIEWMRCKSTNLDSIVQHPALKISASVSCAKKTASYLWFLCFRTWYLPMNEIWSLVSPAPIYSTHIYFVSPSPCRRKRLGFSVVGVFLFRHCLLFQILKYGNTAGFFTEFLRTCHFSSLAVERMKSHVPFKRPEIFSDSIAMGLHGETTYGETFGGGGGQFQRIHSTRNPCQLLFF